MEGSSHNPVPAGSYQPPRPHPVSENEMFVTMIVAAQEDEDMKEQILTIARLDPLHREALIDALAADLRQYGGAAASLASAIVCLKDNAVALKTIKALTQG